MEWHVKTICFFITREFPVFPCKWYKVPKVKKILQILKTLKTFEIVGAWFVQSKVKKTQG